MASIEDRWHYGRKPRRGEEICEHKKVPKPRHGRGDQYRVRYKDPSRRWRNASFARFDDAKAFKATTEADLIRGKWADPDAGRQLLRDYAREWLAGRHGEPSTLEALRSRVNKWILPELGSLRLADIKPSRVQSFISGLPLVAGTARGCSPP